MKNASPSIVPAHYRLLRWDEKLRELDFYTHPQFRPGHVAKNPGGVAGDWPEHRIYRRRHVRTKW